MHPSDSEISLDFFNSFRVDRIQFPLYESLMELGREANAGNWGKIHQCLLLKKHLP